MGKVVVLKIRSSMEEEVENLIQLAGGEDLISAGDTVLLKPNLHSTQPYTTGSTTNPYIVEALIKWVRGRGAREIIVGDSPFYKLPEPEKCFTDTGMGSAVERAGARWVMFGNHGFEIFRDLPGPLPEMGISEFVLNCDKLINIAVMKTHCDCLVTLGMKNLKGCIRDKDKAEAHRIDINRAIVEINGLIKPHLTIVDGTVGMEGVGPAGGTPVNCDLLLAGRDIVAVDSVAGYLMGIEPEEVMTTKLGYEAGLGEMNLDRIEVIGEEIEGMKMHWKRPDTVIAEKFPWLNVRNRGACSGCNINFFKVLNELDGEGKEAKRKTIVMGQDTPVEKRSALIGKCTSPFWKDYDHLGGCPPKTESIKKFIS